MANYITVDGGTTNTRASLVCHNTVLATKKMDIGVGKKDIAALKNAIKTAIAELLAENDLAEKEIECILASGMITSEYGLCNLPHLTAPAGAAELHHAMHKTTIADVSDIPFVFIRGVKKNGDDLDGTDMMRGEETELMGMLQGDRQGCLYVLPGSHSKHITVSDCGSIVDLRTMLTGELLAAVMGHTILRDAADLGSDIDETALKSGFAYAQKRGINEALFKTRILKTLFNATKSQCYGFLLGCVLCDEVTSILQASEQTVILGGQKQLRTAMALLLKKYSDKTVVMLSDTQVAHSTALGAVRIYECC